MMLSEFVERTGFEPLPCIIEKEEMPCHLSGIYIQTPVLLNMPLCLRSW